MTSCDPIIVFYNLFMFEMSVLLGFVSIRVKLPSSAPIFWFDVLSLVDLVAGLHCLPSTFNLSGEVTLFAARCPLNVLPITFSLFEVV